MPALPEKLVNNKIYGEDTPQAVQNNRKGKLYQEYTNAGLIEHEAYDFKGNLLSQHFRFIKSSQAKRTGKIQDIQVVINALDSKKYIIKNEFDALNRPFRVTYPDHTRVEKLFDKRGLVQKVKVQLGDTRSWTDYITRIEYNPKEQKTYIKYENQVSSRFEYHPETYDLINIRTTRASDAKVLQDIHYTYDPMGNVLESSDQAQPTNYYKNEKVGPITKYQYDPLYRLIKVEGREHVGQANHQRSTQLDHPIDAIPDSTDMNAMRNYARTYDYDSVGNILQMKQIARDASWTLEYAYDETTNKLKSTKHATQNHFNNGMYQYDENGNMTSMPHINKLVWDQENRLTGINNGNSPSAVEAAYFYNGKGERVMKLVKRGQNLEERLYVSGFEVYRLYRNASITTERLQWMVKLDDDTPLLIIEKSMIKEGNNVTNPKPHFRYQFSNHLKSSVMECDENGKTISYEEYYPFGVSSLFVQRGQSEVSKKRYRYLNKEKDEESGFYYFGLRYYIPWLGRWCSPDPAGVVDGNNLFVYVKNNPLKYTDPNGTKGITSKIDLPGGGYESAHTGADTTGEHGGGIVTEGTGERHFDFSDTPAEITATPKEGDPSPNLSDAQSGEAPSSSNPSDALSQEAPNSSNPSDVLSGETPNSSDPSDVLSQEAPSSSDPSNALSQEAPNSSNPSDVLSGEAPNSNDPSSDLSNPGRRSNPNPENKDNLSPAVRAWQEGRDAYVKYLNDQSKEKAKLVGALYADLFVKGAITAASGGLGSAAGSQMASAGYGATSQAVGNFATKKLADYSTKGLYYSAKMIYQKFRSRF